mgnify:CR=1 FL=1
MTNMVKKPSDTFVSAQNKQRRTIGGKAQTEVGNRGGITLQQGQKDEKGAHRVRSRRLDENAEILGVPIQSFFEGVEEVIQAKNSKKADKRTKDSTLGKFDEFISSPSGVDMIKAFVEIEDPSVRKQIAARVKSVSRAP